jgi:NitT/TauT family transport system substrate-binding protein
MSGTKLNPPVSEQFSRRQFLKAAGGLGLTVAGMSLLEACGVRPAAPSAVSGGLETTTIRIPLSEKVSICQAPLWVAEDFLRAEGFTDIQYIQSPAATLVVDDLANGQGDITLQFSGPTILYLDGGKPLTILAGVHVGCFVLFGSAGVKAIGDLRGKTLAISQIGGPDHVYLASMLANVNIDPVKEVTWTTLPPPETKQLFIDGKIDAVMAFPPTAQELFDKQIGHVVANSMSDKPWSDYYCCMVTVSQDYLRQNPVATKAALRSILKATDVCALHPDQPAKIMVEKGFAPDYKYALEAMAEIPYNRWRVYDPEDTIRFYALLLHGVGMIKSTPDELIKQGTDWTFLKQLKAELPVTPAPAAGLAATRNLFCAVPGSQSIKTQQRRNAE